MTSKRAQRIREAILKITDPVERVQCVVALEKIMRVLVADDRKAWQDVAKRRRAKAAKEEAKQA